MADVFISYKTGDRPRVQRLVQGLRAEGLGIWWDQDIALGEPWELTIERALEDARAVLVAWSPEAVTSEHVKAEARRACEQGKLIQVFLAPCDPPLFFGERQGVSLVGWAGDAADPRFQTVLAAARAIVAGKPPPSGVGYVPKHKARRWEALGAAITATAAALSLVANLGGVRDTLCRIGPLQPTCRAWGLTRPAPPSAEAVAAAARQKLLQAVNGVWGPQNGSCAHAITIESVTDSDGLSRITISGADAFKSSGQVVAAENGVIISRNTTATAEGPRAQWEYHPNGDQMTVIDKDGVSTTLVRCTTAPGKTKI
jgi:hypothetical protein